MSNTEEEHDNNDTQTEPALSLNHDTIFELVDPGTFVETQSPKCYRVIFHCQSV